MEKIEFSNKCRRSLYAIIAALNDKPANAGHLCQVGRNGDRGRTGAAIDDGAVVGGVGLVKRFCSESYCFIQKQVFVVYPCPDLNNISLFSGIDRLLDRGVFI